MKPAKEVASKEDKMKPAKDTASKAEKAKPAKEAASKAEKTKAAKDTASKNTVLSLFHSKYIVMSSIAAVFIVVLAIPLYFTQTQKRHLNPLL